MQQLNNIIKVLFSFCPFCLTVLSMLASLLYDPKVAAAAPVIMTLCQHPKQKERIKNKKLSSPRSDILVPTEFLLYLIDKAESHAHTNTG